MQNNDTLLKLAAAGFRAGMTPQQMDYVFEYYQESGRVYHGLQHLEKLYSRVLKMGLELTQSQVLALIFHDVVYFPGWSGKSSNEEMSADLFMSLAKNPEKISKRVKAEVRQIILDTTEHVATIPESRLILDLDLSGLGQAPADFEQDSMDVYQELNLPGLDWPAYCVARAKFFAGLLERRGGRVFETEQFAPLEAQAQENLARAAAFTA